MPDPAKSGGGSSGIGISLQPQCLQTRACFKTNSAQSGQVTCVLGLGMLSADGVRTLRSFDAARNNPARIGLIRTASTNQPKPLRPLLLAQIPMAMETPNQNKSISIASQFVLIDSGGLSFILKLLQSASLTPQVLPDLTRLSASSHVIQVSRRPSK